MDPNQIFISYAREDRPKAEALAAVLAQRGWSAWWDREIPVGLAFDEVIEKALDGARCVVVLWSAHSVASRWVKAEAQAGLDKDRLVPVLLDEEVRLPLAFRAIEGAQLHDWDGESAHPELDKLARRITELVGSASPGPPRPEPLVAPPPPAERRALTQKMVLLVGVAMAAAAFGAWTVFGSSKQPAPTPVSTLPNTTVSGSTPAIQPIPPAPPVRPILTDPPPSAAQQLIPAAVAANPKAFVLAAKAPRPRAARAMDTAKPFKRRVQGALDEIDEDAPASPLSKSAVVAGMNAVKGKVSECFGEFQVPGMAMVNVVIGKMGKVRSATVTGKFAGTPTGTCVENAVKTASFPPSDGLTTPYPFQLK